MPDTLCPFCGAYSTQQCELEEEMPGCSCPWEDQLSDGREREDEETDNLRRARSVLPQKEAASDE